MKAYSDRRPDAQTVERIGGIAVVTMRRNIESRTIEEESGERIEYSWDERRRAFPWFERMAADIAAHEAAWWAMCGKREAGETTLHDVEAALAELSDSVSSGAESATDLEDAVAELSEIVSELVPREE